MPLSTAGNKIKRKMIEEYGKKRGEKVFYSKENGDKEFANRVRGKKAKAEWWVERLIDFSPSIKAKVLENFKVDPELVWWINRMFALNKAQHEGYLVTDAKGNQHLPTHSNGKPNHRLMGAAWASLHGGYRGNKYEGPNKSQAISKLKKLYAKEGLTAPEGKKSVSGAPQTWEESA